jgi:hypothetical protein
MESGVRIGHDGVLIQERRWRHLRGFRWAAFRLKLSRQTRVTCYMHLRPLIFGIFAMFQLLSPAAADVVYRWVDEGGVTHFSDSPPAAQDTVQGGVESIALPDNFPAAADPAGDYYSIVNQWKRMREERNEREKLALEEERLRLEQSRAELVAGQAASAAPAAVDTTPVVVYGGFPRFDPRPYIHSQRVFHSMQPVFFRGLPRREFMPRSQVHRQYAPAHFRMGHSRPDQVPAPAARVTFKCCRGSN